VIIGAIVAVVVLIVGVRYLAYAMTHETTDDARVAADDVTLEAKSASASSASSSTPISA
jgi:multidrug resistance efflux pump